MIVTAPVAAPQCDLENKVTEKNLTWVKRREGAEILVIVAPDVETVETPETLTNLINRVSRYP